MSLPANMWNCSEMTYFWVHYIYCPVPNHRGNGSQILLSPGWCEILSSRWLSFPVFSCSWTTFHSAISLVLFFKVWELAHSWKPAFVEILNLKKNIKGCTFTCCGWKINKLEIAAFVLIFSLPLLFDWIPFVINSYGSTRGPICWMYSLKSDCSINEAGLWEDIWLWNVPYGFVALLTILPFVASWFCLLGRGIRNAKFQKLIEVGSFDSLISLAFLSFAFILETTCNYYFSFQDHNLCCLGELLVIPLRSTQ